MLRTSTKIVTRDQIEDPEKILEDPGYLDVYLVVFYCVRQCSNNLLTRTGSGVGRRTAAGEYSCIPRLNGEGLAEVRSAVKRGGEEEEKRSYGKMREI